MAKPDWIIVSPQSGTGGGEVQITASPNGIEERNGTVTVETASGLTKTVSVFQAAGNFNMDVLFTGINVQNNNLEGGWDLYCEVSLYSGEKSFFAAKGKTISLGTTPSLEYTDSLSTRADPPQNWSGISVYPSIGKFTHLEIIVGSDTIFSGTPEHYTHVYPIDPPRSYKLADEYASIEIKGTILVE